MLSLTNCKWLWINKKKAPGSEGERKRKGEGERDEREKQREGARERERERERECQRGEKLGGKQKKACQRRGGHSRTKPTLVKTPNPPPAGPAPPSSEGLI